MKTRLVFFGIALVIGLTGCVSVESDWAKARSADTATAYGSFLHRHTDSEYTSMAQAQIADFARKAWAEAQSRDKVPEYERFLRTYPNSEFSEQARTRMEWQKANRAIVDISYPETVQPHGRYRWDTVFKETGGKAGFTLRATNFHIRDPRGGRWSNSWSESVTVKPNGTGRSDYWCDVSDKWSGGHYYTTWVGEDDYGNRISIVQKGHLAK